MRSRLGNSARCADACNVLGHGSHCRQFWREYYREDDPHYWYYSNIEDPNDRGYDALRRIFLLEIARVLCPGNDT